MKANELRIGNLIYSSSGGVKYVVGTSYKTILHSSSLESYTYYEDYDSNCEPIPLTEEILLKCGFQIRDKKYSLNYGGESMRFAILENDIRNPFILYFHGRFGFNLNEGRKNGDYCIQYVHQLQNLYWCLCGKELTFNNL